MCIDWISFWANIVPDKTAIITSDDQNTYSYGHLNKSGWQYCTLLRNEFQIKKNDRICILGQFDITYIELFSCALKSGIILVPINYRLTGPEIESLIRDADPSLVIVESQFLSTVSKISTLPIIEFKELRKRALAQDVIPDLYNEVIPDDAAFVLYTSGSTGIPKGVLYTYKMMFWNSVNTSISLNLDSNTTSVICMPPFHTGGWNVLLTPLLHTGGSLILMKKWDAGEVLYNLEKHQCSIFMAVPTMLKLLTEHQDFEKVNLDSLEYIIVGGEPLSIPLINIYEKKGIYIRQGYGMTEVGPNLTSLHQKDAIRKKGSIGKPNMYVDLEIVDDYGNPVKNGLQGEFRFRGPIVTPGYLNNRTQAVRDDGWFYTGDIARRDDEGYLYIVDRKKNMFISGGENVYPAEIEKVLLSHPSVSECVVMGVPHQKWGEVGKAFVSLHKMMDEKELKEHCAQYLSKFKIPKFFEFVENIPKSATGKIDRLSLK